MKQKLLILWILGNLWLVVQSGYGQCTTGCTYTATSNGNYNLNGSQKICITSNVSDLNINFNGSGNSICVGSGVTWTQSNGGNFSGVTIDVYGTFVMNGNYNFNGPVVVNVQVGGVLQTNSTGFGSNLTINNYGKVTYTTAGSINNQGTFSLTNFASATLTAPNSTLFKMDSGTGLLNYGTIVLPNLENQDANLQNYLGGTITVGRYFNNHGNFVNNGTVQVLCSAGSGTCGFTVGNKGPGKEFTNNACMSVNGDVTFNGPGFINGTLEVLGSSNLTLNATVSGTNGRIIVNTGTSTIGAAGQYTGTLMRFCDRSSTNGNKFDVNSGNSTSTYTVDCSANTCGAVSCALALTATPGLCTPATNQYSVTGTVSLTSNTTGGSLTVTDGSSTTTITVAANASSASFTLTGFTSNASSHTVTASLPGCGSAIQTYTAPVSCSCAALTVTTTPQPGSAICQGQSVTLSAQVSPAGSYTYVWAGAGTITNGNTATATISGLPTGTSTFTVTVRSSATCSTTATASVTVNALPTATLSSATICSGTSATLTATGGTSYTFSNGTTNSTGLLVVSPATTTAYSVTVSNAGGCTASASGTVVVNTTPGVSATNTGPLTCTLTVVTVSASSTATGVTYRWAGPNSFTSNAASFTTATAGVYAVTATGNTGCTATATTTVQSNTTTPTITASNNGPLTCAFTTVTLNTTVTNATSPTYLWSTGATTSSITVTMPGIYSVTVTSAPTGCAASTITQVLTQAVVLCPKVNTSKL